MSGMFGKALETSNKAVQEKKSNPEKSIISESVIDLINLETAKIHPDPNQPRKEWLENELEELTASISESKGCHTPIKVRPHPELKGEFMIVYGEGRWLSHNKLKFPTIPALFDTHINEYQIRFEQLTENLSRKSMTRLDEAFAIKALMNTHDPKLKQKEIAVKIGKPTSFVSRLLKLVKAPSVIQDLSRNGTTQNINVLDSLIKIAELISDEELANYVECVVSGAISEKDLLQALSDFKNADKEDENHQEEQHSIFKDSSESGSVTDPLGSDSDDSDYQGCNDTTEQKDYGYYDYSNVYEKALFDALIKYDVAYDLTAEQVEEAAEKLITATQELEEQGHSLDKLLKLFVQHMPSENPTVVVLNIRKVRQLLNDALEQHSSDEATNQNEEIADLQVLEVESYEVFKDHVMISLSGISSKLRISKQDLNDMVAS
ncbi:hypothetical protein BCT75_04325 [Vibrio lentus]|uniref:ParB/RepB/Spo0J family partition protein n=1 Tax=Vibrio lentus TaxID=136468 RepID=UPI000C844338|nr:ParB/RepB/Spo0J family partition protein [Vibrio lentus]PML45615.1 hypothetical protein BCT75_04325 [Vibrio lentus]